MSAQLQSLKDALVNNVALEEKVEVNQRHLIDKILARYSAEFTVFRELLQNSNDAGATEVQILFQTNADTQQKFSIFAKGPQLTSVTYKNNGRPFSAEDFARLRKIAEGNPDEQKIGFFGVGFYSLFSICEEPFVTSGDQSMAFLWKGDMLYTKKGPIPPEQISPWTCFFLNLREPIDIPTVKDFGRFLATSLGFTANLKKVEVFVDDDRILYFDKKIADPRPLEFAKGVYDLESPNKCFLLERVVVRRIQLDVEFYPTFDKSRSRRGDKSTYTIFMRTAGGTLKVKLDATTAKEMERTTKKRAPPTTEMQIMFSNFDEFESSTKTDKGGDGSLFEDLVPRVGKQGRVFIGFPTHQTTGCSVQLAAHLIPTVERESIDFVDKTLNIWNQNILTVSGLLSRILYDDDMSAISRLYTEMHLDPESTTYLNNRAAHAMASFTFKDSTPSRLVSQILKSYFFKSGKQPLSLMSSKGVLPVTGVRLMDEKMKGFIRDVAVVPESVVEGCKDMIEYLRSEGLIKPLGLEDVFRELEGRVLDTEEMVSVMGWWIEYRKRNVVSQAELDRFLKGARVKDAKEGTEGRVVSLSGVRHHATAKIVPPDLPIEDTVLPLEVGRKFEKRDLESMFGGWTELSVYGWAVYVTNLPQFGTDADLVERALGNLSRHYNNINNESRTLLVSLLQRKPCIPTKQGLRTPQDTYFKTVTLFPDLPTIHLTHSKSVADSFLKILGVREHVELQMVFDNLATLKWDHIQLIKYLASVQGKLTDTEVQRLRVTPLFPREGQEEGRRWRAEELFFPQEQLRGFGVSLLSWRGKWRGGTDEARFLNHLGMRTILPVEMIIHLASTAFPERRTQLLNYFLEHYKTLIHSYEPHTITTPFLPTTVPDVLAKPTEVFADAGSGVMGFKILAEEWRGSASKLGVGNHPGCGELMDWVRKNRVESVEKGRVVFGYLGTRMSEFGDAQWTELRTKQFIPIQNRDPHTQSTHPITYVAPSMAYFARSFETNSDDHFTRIDFGPIGNGFLRGAGVKDEPTTPELAAQLVRQPRVFLESMGVEGYLGMLRRIAAEFGMLRSRHRGVVEEMKRAEWVLGQKGVQVQDEETDDAATVSEKEGSSTKEKEMHLARPDQVYLIDDTVSGQLFEPLSAPIGDKMLEELYAELGSRWLSTCVREDIVHQGQPRATPVSQRLERLIRERAALLLYDGSSSLRGSRELQPDAEKLLKTVKCWEVPSIEVVRQFQGVVKRDRGTAEVTKESATRWGGGTFINVFVVSEYDHFDVARALGGVVLRHCRLNDTLLLEKLMSSSLGNLRRKGFPVDRILGTVQHSGKFKVAEQQQQQEQEQQSTAVAARDAGARVGGKEGQEMVEMLKSMFPDADLGYLRREVEKGLKGGQKIEDVVDRVLASGAQMDTPAGRKESANNSRAGSRESVRSEDDGGGGGFSFRNLGKRLEGFYKEISGIPPAASDRAETPSSSASWVTESESPSPPQKQQRTQKVTTVVRNTGTTMPVEEIGPGMTSKLKDHLEKSIGTLKGTRESNIRATIPADPDLSTLPPSALMRQTAERCAVISDSDLILSHHVLGVPLYIDRALNVPEAQSLLKNARARGVEKFVGVLRVLAVKVFGSDLGVVHLYYDK
ncbi:hypothetical protein HK097_000176, partial [Rhizophlyctis rosea]